MSAQEAVVHGHSAGDATDPDTQKRSFASVIGGVIHRLQGDRGEGSTSRDTRARAVLSRLRRAAGRTAANDSLAWADVLDLVSEEFEEDWFGRGDAPSASESAAFTALSLYAVHQGSHANRMHQPGNSLGAAVGRLARQRDSKSIKARFDALLAARTAGATTYHLRSLITLLGAEGIALDYGRLATDLRNILWSLDTPNRPAGREALDRVHLRWARDFARALSRSGTVSEESAQ